MIQNIIEKARKENKKVYVYAHKFPDGDAISSSCSIVEYLKSNGIDARYVITNPVNSYTQVVGKTPTTQTVDSKSISLIVDTSTLDYAENKMFLASQPEDIYVIDHHMKAKGKSCIEDELNLPNDNVLRDSSASSTCEILESEFEREKISPQIANMLTLGLITDTAKLKFLKPDTLQNLQTLLQAGADYNYIISMCTRKSSLRNEVGLAKVLLNSQKIAIGDTLGIVLPIDNKTVTSMNSQYGLRAIQKKIFKMSDITNCSFNCILAENTSGEFDLEFRSSSVYGNFDVQKLATMFGGGGHYNASGCHLGKESTRDVKAIFDMIESKSEMFFKQAAGLSNTDGMYMISLPDIDESTNEGWESILDENGNYDGQAIFNAIIQSVSDMYSEQATNLETITLSDTDKELASILDETDRLTKGVTLEILSKVDALRKQGANYDYTFKTFKTFERFMLENEILSRVPNTKLSEKLPTVDIALSLQDVDTLCQRYHVSESEILSVIDIFSNINIQSASISLPNGKKTTIDRKGNISKGQLNIERTVRNDSVR